MSALVAANLALRFALEIAGLLAIGYWGFATIEPPALKWPVGIGLPVLLAVIWAVFRIPNDGGAPVVAVTGQVRLAIEAGFFALAIGGLFHAGRPAWASVLLVLVIGHYAIDYPRTLDLLLGRR